MKFENFILEVFGIVYPAAMVYAVNMHFPLAPLFPVLNEQDNLIRTCGIASAIYLIGRIYYGVIFFVTSKITHKRAEQIVTMLLSLAPFVAPFFLPVVQQIFQKLYDDNLKDMVGALYDTSKEDILKSYNFGLRIGGLILAWFLIFFVGELVLRVVLIVIGYVCSSIYSAIFPKKILRVKRVKGQGKDEQEGEEEEETIDGSKGGIKCENGVCNADAGNQSSPPPPFVSSDDDALRTAESAAAVRG